jgi:two-component system OmpR family sensor kinase
VSRLPLPLRLTLAFALAMAAVLVATGVFLYVRLGSSLDAAIDEGLEARGADVAALVARNERGLGPGLESASRDQDERFAQVLAVGGGIVDATPQVSGRPLVDADEMARAMREGPFTLERHDVPGIDGRARLLAMPIESAEPGAVLVVGASLEERDDAVRELLGALLVVGPAALLLASLLGYALATAALRPVESMRAEAAAISAAEPGRRLPLPRARDEVFRLGATLNDMLARLEGALARERSFVADASHELRTPLALLKAELELALRRPRTAAELEQALRSAAAETDHLTRLTEDLLVLARSDQARLPLRRAPVSAAATLSKVASRFRQEAENAGRTIAVDAPDGVEVVGDGDRLEQALGNVVQNALHHGGGSIRLSAVESDARVELHVVDKGAGFPPEFLPRAFERFSRADEARSGDRAGLGLAIVDVIAKAHGGSAHAANRGDGGADVWLSIPTRKRGDATDAGS